MWTPAYNPARRKIFILQHTLMQQACTKWVIIIKMIPKNCGCFMTNYSERDSYDTSDDIVAYSVILIVCKLNQNMVYCEFINEIGHKWEHGRFKKVQ